MKTWVSKINKNIWIGLAAAAVLIVLIVCISILGRSTVPPAEADFSAVSRTEGLSEDTVLPEGIYIGTVYVGGRTVGEARSLLSEAYQQPKNQTVEIYWGEDIISTSLEDLGVRWNIEGALIQAAQLGKCTGPLGRYINNMNLRYGRVHLDLAKTLDEGLVRAFVEQEISDKYDFQAHNARLTLGEDGEPVIIPNKNGYQTDKEATIHTILANFYEMDPNDKLIAIATVKAFEPDRTTEDLAGMTDLLGSCTTRYLEDGYSRTERCVNVEVACDFINATIIQPGESKSTSEMMHARIAENGYRTGTQYVDGELEDAIGGGVCQVATTLYGALLRAEIEIDERSNHSMLVKYVKPSFDAAISTGTKDLIFTNDTDSPIYIEGVYDGNYVSFNIFGKETRPSNRTVEYVSVVDRRVESKPEIVTDPNLPPGDSETVGSLHDEVDSHLVKIVSVDGEEVSRTTLHYDYYQPSYQTIYVAP